MPLNFETFPNDLTVASFAEQYLPVLWVRRNSGVVRK